jgi:hypothetical protein
MQKQNKLKIILITALTVLLMSLSAGFALQIPERLEYDLTWFGILAGYASIEVKDKDDEVQFISNAISAPVISAFYKVEDSAVSTLRKGPHKTLPGILQNNRVKISEGTHRKDRESQFDIRHKKLTFIDHLKDERVVYDKEKITEDTMDALTCFYHVRYQPLEVGKTLYAHLFDNKKFYVLEVQVLKREEIETPLGKFNTILIKPILLTEGIFGRKGEVLIWLTDDEKRLPVLLKTKVKIGSIKATMTGGTY